MTPKERTIATPTEMYSKSVIVGSYARLAAREYLKSSTWDCQHRVSAKQLPFRPRIVSFTSALPSTT